MPEGKGFAASIARNVRMSAASWTATMLISFASTAAVSTWGYLRQLTLPEIIWFASLTLPATSAGVGSFLVVSRWAWGLLSRQIRIQFDPETNKNSTQCRVVVTNLSHFRPLKNLQVKIESLVPLTNTEALREKSMQFTNAPVKIERGQQKMELGAADSVEVWIARHSTGQTAIRFFTPDDEVVWMCDLGEYLLTLIAVGENVPAERKSFYIAAQQDGGLTFEPRPTRRRPA